MGNYSIMIAEKSVLVEFLGDTPLVRIIDFLIEKRPFETTKEEIIKETGIARNSLFKIWEKLERYEIVKLTRKIGKAEMFVLNDENEIVDKLLKLEFDLIKRAMDEAQVSISTKAEQYSYEEVKDKMGRIKTA